MLFYKDILIKIIRKIRSSPIALQTYGRTDKVNYREASLLKSDKYINLV